jgi:hypothetical protein
MLVGVSSGSHVAVGSMDYLTRVAGTAGEAKETRREPILRAHVRQFKKSSFRNQF